MADQKTSLPIFSRAASKPVSVSKDTSANAVGNPIYAQLSDGVDKLDLVVINSAYGATPVTLPVAGKYEATPTTYDDGDAVPILLDANGRLQISNADEDNAHVSGDSGMHALVVRKDLSTGALSSNVDTDGDYASILQDGFGSLYVTQVDQNGKANTETSPMYVQVVDSNVSALEIVDYDTAAAVAADATSNHDYEVTATKTLKVHKIEASASGAMKIEAQAGPVASLATKIVGFTSMANPNFIYDFAGILEIPDTGTGTLRLIRTNRDDDAMDVYSTVSGYEV
ncbi:MAG: hypothetical protein GY817_01200 [bacterium]|nr:hypothetical protein [bacterium]